MSNKLKYFVIGISIVAAYFAFTVYQKRSNETQVAKSAAPAAAPADAAAAAKPAEPAPMNGISKAFADQGVTNCVEKITQVTNFIGVGENTGAFLFPHLKDADKGLLSVSMEVGGDKGVFAYASANFAPTGKNTCSGQYDAVAYWPQACIDVAKTQFKGAKIASLLKKNIGVIELGPTTRVFLMGVDKEACVTIKKELVF